MHQSAPTLIVFALACAVPPPLASPGMPFRRWHVNALEQRCPIPGLTAAAVREYWGRPDSIDITSDSTELWVYSRRQPHLRLVIAKGVVTSWDVNGPVSSRLSQPDRRWWPDQGRGFPARVTEYLRDRPGYPPARAYACIEHAHNQA
jgi:hypothetical protein